MDKIARAVGANKFVRHFGYPEIDYFGAQTL